MERTALLLKPDAVERGLTFEIAERFEKRGLAMAACRMLRATDAQAREHCKRSLGGKPAAAVDAAVALLTSGPLVAMAWEGVGAVEIAREVAGDANPMKAGPGTVRGDLSMSEERNLVDVSSSAAAAKLDLALWLTSDDLGAEPAALPPAAAEGVKTKKEPKVSVAVAAAAKAASTPNPSVASAADGDGAEGKSKGQLRKEAKKLEKSAKKAENQGAPAEPTISFEPPSGTRDFFPEQV